MNKMRLFCCTVVFFTISLFANPIDSRCLPLISEVFVQSPTQWYVELNMSYADDYGSFPCTTSTYSLKIASMKKTYKLQFFVDKSRVAVITRASITDIPVTEQVTLASYDTITIMDSSKTYQGVWKFPIRPVHSGYSLCNTSTVSSPGAIPETKETDKVSIGAIGNPPGAYTNPFISEVQFVDSAHWAIELYYNYSRNPLNATFPCTLSLKLRVLSSPSIYPVKAIFGANKIAVLRSSEQVQKPAVFQGITYPTSIRLYDSDYDSILRNCFYWDFYIKQPIDSSHSLINGGNVQTTRVNIGEYTNMYLTEYKLCFSNQAGKPVSNVNIYSIADTTFIHYNGTCFDTVQKGCLYQMCTSLGDTFDVIRSLSDSSVLYGFSRDKIPNGLCTKKSDLNGIWWQGRYNDSVVFKADTIILPDPLAISHYKDEKKNLQKFNHLVLNDKQVLFSAVFLNKVSSAQIRILSLDGKLVTTVLFDQVTNAGTYSCEWNHTKSARAGVYLCTLIIDGVEVSSQKLRL